MLQRLLRLGAALAAIAVPTLPAAAQAPLELKVSHYLPPNHTVQKVLEDWSHELEAKSGGRLKLRVYPAGQLGPVQRQFDLARNGQADMAVGLVGATPGRYPTTELANLPFVAPSAGTTSAVMSRRITELGPEYLAPEFAGLHLLWLGMTPENSFFTGRREIAKADDLRGLKIRFQGEVTARVLRELGAVPLQVPPGDIADGLSKGVIDGATFNYEAAESFGLGTATRHVVEPGFTSGTLVLVMNAGRYQALPADLRAIVDETTGPDAAAKLGERWDAAEQHGRAYMQSSNVSINTLSAAEVQHIQATLAPMVKQATEAVDKAGKPGTAFLANYVR